MTDKPANNCSHQENKEVCFIMPSMAGGGAERVVSILLGQFAEFGIKTSLYLVKHNIIEYDIDSRVKVDTSLCNSGKNPLNQIKDIRVLIKNNPDAVFVSFLPYQNIYTVVADFFLKNRVVVSLRNDPKRIENGSKILRLATRIIFCLADYVVFQTTDAQKYYGRLIQNKSKVILNPIQSQIPEYNVEGTQKKIITFCRLDRQKNLPMAIRAFKKFHDTHSDYTYHIFGNGDEKAKLIQIIKELNLQNCVFIENFKSDILEEAKSYRAFILPSDYEGLSNSMIEALAMGMPSICTDCPIGGARMIINNLENGFLIPVGDEESLLKAMDKIADIDYCIKISKDAKKLAARLRADLIAKQWLEVLFQ